MPKLHLILPMAGRGSRFFENGFVCPKPLIEIAGKPFFYWAARSIEKYVDCADLTFVVLEEHIRDFAIDAKIKAYWPDARIIALPAVTEGAAITALRGAEGRKESIRYHLQSTAFQSYFIFIINSLTNRLTRHERHWKNRDFFIMIAYRNKLAALFKY